MIHSVVVGGSGGLGRAICAAFTARGDSVSALSRGSQPPCDIHDGSQAEKAIDAVTLGKGPITNLVFAQRDRDGMESLEARFDEFVTGADRFLTAAVKFLTEPASVVFITSTDDSAVRQRQSEGYHVGKAGLLHLMRYRAVQLAPVGVRCNAVAPGTFLSERNRREAAGTPLTELIVKITPLGRVGNAKDVASAVLWLCSDQSSFVTGQRICVDGGLSLLSQESLARKLMNV